MGRTPERKTRLKEKYEEKKRQQLAVARVLKKANAEAKKSHVSGPKRKTADNLLHFIESVIVPHSQVRTIDTFRCKTYNLDKQIRALVDHLYVNYAVPEFLYPCMYSTSGKVEVLRQEKQVALKKQKRAQIVLEQSLFMACASGQSLAPILKPWLTKKEVHAFFQGAESGSMVQNMFQAKLVVAGVRKEWIEHLVPQFTTAFWTRGLNSTFVADFCRIFATDEQKLGLRQFRAMVDYVANMEKEAQFSLKGRTFESLLKASTEWHRRNIWGRVVNFECWPSTYPLWTCESYGLHVRVQELTNNHLLHDETYEQEHCVFSYWHKCKAGFSRILSVRWYQGGVGAAIVSRVTIEIETGSNQIVQIRGKHNRVATKQEMEAIRIWAGEHGVTISRLAK